MENNKSGAMDPGAPVAAPSEQDRYLPIANVGRIMKDALSSKKEAKIARDARETVQECVSDFITFITSE